MELDIIYNEDCLEGLKGLPDASVDLVCTDPPYSLKFMQMAWDQALPSVDVWKECLRVLKPGAFAFVMCIPRQDCLSRMIVNLEDAGFNVSFSSLYWCYATGFPKAMSISKVVDKRLGLERKVVGTYVTPDGRDYTKEQSCRHGYNKTDLSMGRDKGTERRVLTEAASPEAKALDGSYAGFQPKPALEVVLVAMRPLSEKTYIDQAMANGKGVTWLSSGAIPVEPFSSSDSGVSAPEPSQDFFAANVWKILVGACGRVQDFASPTILCNTNYINRVHHVAGSDYSLGRELSRWLSACQDGDEKCASVELSVQGSQCDCPACCRLYDELSHVAQADGLDASPSQADVLSYICEFVLSQVHNPHHLCSVRLSIVDGLFRILSVLALGDNSAYSDSLVEMFMAYYYYTSNARKSQGNKYSSRFPANLLVSDDVLNDAKEHKAGGFGHTRNAWFDEAGKQKVTGNFYGDSGSYSRYFSLDSWWAERIKQLPESVQKTFPFLIVPKAGKKEKNKGLESMPEKQMYKCDNSGQSLEIFGTTDGGRLPRQNNHPCIKPIKLMSYLITIGSREGDVILDPFLGSGTTAVACKMLNRRFIGYEIDADFCEIARRRVAAVGAQPDFFSEARVADEDTVEQLDLFAWAAG